MSHVSYYEQVQIPIISTRKIFFIAGFCLASWAPFIPLTKVRLNIDNGLMGIILLAFGLGSLIMMPISGMLAAKYGCRRIFTLALFLSLTMLFCLVYVNSIIIIALSLFLFGVGIGAMDVVANIHAVSVEKIAHKPVMSGFHALFSLGGAVGAAVVSGLLSSGIEPLHIVFLIVAFSIILMLTSWYGMLNEGSSDEAPFFVMPHGAVIILGLLCFIAYLMEGSMLDWSGILLINQQHISVDEAGIGYTLFATTMTLGRFTGDKIIKKFGSKNIFLYSSILSTMGYVILLLNGNIFFMCCAFLLIGLGLSNIAPILFSATGKQKVMPDSLAVAAVSTLGYSGILLGPAFIGGIAHISSLVVSFICVAILSLGLIFSTFHLFNPK